MIEAVLSFCHQCEEVHILNEVDQSEIWFCPRLETIATRKIPDGRWILQKFTLEDLARVKLEQQGIKQIGAEDLERMGRA